MTRMVQIRQCLRRNGQVLGHQLAGPLPMQLQTRNATVVHKQFTQISFPLKNFADFGQEHDELAGSSSHNPDVTVFLDSKRQRRESSPLSKELKKSFMVVPLVPML